MLQADFSLTYIEKNLYLPTSFCKDFFQGHFLEIPGLDSPTEMHRLITPPYLAGPTKKHRRAMQVQVLLKIGRYCLTKEETGELMDQRVHVVTTT